MSPAFCWCEIEIDEADDDNRHRQGMFPSVDEEQWQQETGPGQTQAEGATELMWDSVVPCTKYF